MGLIQTTYSDPDEFDGARSISIIAAHVDTFEATFEDPSDPATPSRTKVYMQGGSVHTVDAGYSTFLAAWRKAMGGDD